MAKCVIMCAKSPLSSYNTKAPIPAPVAKFGKLGRRKKLNFAKLLAENEKLSLGCLGAFYP
jgi:hypothetical protein